jgi:Uma2 family endonuclease
MNGTEGSSALDLEKRYTLADWRSWPDDERWELINGVAYNMSPAPRVKHQERAFELGRKLANYLENKLCKVYMAPLDVFLPEPGLKTMDDASKSDSSDTVVQPDVLAVCNPDKIHDNGIHGAPDFVVEVLSDSTANKDFSIKLELYEKNGVREYWIIQPETTTVFQYVLEGDTFAPVREFRRGIAVPSAVFAGFSWVCIEDL